MFRQSMVNHQIFAKAFEPSEAWLTVSCRGNIPLPAKRITDGPDRSQRYWFPQSLFDPLHIDRVEVRSVAANHAFFNGIADHIEAITAELELSVVIRGGIVSLAKRSIGFVIDIDPADRKFIETHRQLTRRLIDAYPCKIAGVDKEQDILWLWRIQDIG